MGQSEKSTSNTFPWKEILGFFGVVLAAYIGYLGIRSQIEIPIQATQTAEARLALTSEARLTMEAQSANNVTDVPVIFTDTPTSLPVTPSPTFFAKQQPEQFIRNYYDLINQRDYSKAWKMLTAGFQSRNAPDGFNGYKKFWDGIASAEIQDVEIKEREGINVMVSVTIKYIPKYGAESINTHLFMLTPDATGESWLFEK